MYALQGLLTDNVVPGKEGSRRYQHKQILNRIRHDLLHLSSLPKLEHEAQRREGAANRQNEAPPKTPSPNDMDDRYGCQRSVNCSWYDAAEYGGRLVAADPVWVLGCPASCESDESLHDDCEGEVEI